MLIMACLCALWSWSAMQMLWSTSIMLYLGAEKNINKKSRSEGSDTSNERELGLRLLRRVAQLLLWPVPTRKPKAQIFKQTFLRGMKTAQPTADQQLKMAAAWFTARMRMRTTNSTSTQLPDKTMESQPILCMCMLYVTERTKSTGQRCRAMPKSWNDNIKSEITKRWLNKRISRTSVWK